MLIRKEMANIEIYNIANALLEVFNEDVHLPVKVNFYLQKNIGRMVEMAKDIDKARMEIVKKYGEPLEEDPNQFKIDSEKVDDANKEIQDLFSLKQEVKINTIALEAFDDVDLTSQQVGAIMFMIQDDEEDKE